jgi:dethiobiotin synthetase
LVSAVLVRALNAKYWKPVQCGRPTDAETVSRLLRTTDVIVPTKYLLNTPVSPHEAARLEGKNIQLSDFEKPVVDQHVVIEGAGGWLVPLNQHACIGHLAEKVADKIILVSNHYLGSINHTLLTLQSLEKASVPLAGIVFNGSPNPATEEAILARTSVKMLFRIESLNHINAEKIDDLAKQVPVDQLLV